MKQFIYLIFSSLSLFIVFNIQSCTSDLCEETLRYDRFDPVYITSGQLRNINVESAQELKIPGKIYVYGQYLFVNEQYKGIHIYDNSDLENPVQLSFLSIPGNVDMAIRNDYLYADNYIDLLTFDLKDPSNPILVNHEKDIFTKNRYEHQTLGYLVYYKPTAIVEHIDCNNTYFGSSVFFEDDILFAESGTKSNGNYDSSGGSTGSNGQGGSMARFTIVDDRFYTVDDSDLNVFDVSSASTPTLINTINVGWGIETIFPTKDHLFIGSNTGVFIFDNTNRDNPSYLSEFTHARVCDPVFVYGDIAYVTLRGGSRCGGFTNQLDVLDVSNLSNPSLIKSYPMSNPHGLTILDDKMIICEGQFGLRVLDISNNKDIKTLSTIKNKHFYDAIGLSKDHIILTGDDGIYQYKLSGSNLTELGSIRTAN